MESIDFSEEFSKKIPKVHLKQVAIIVVGLLVIGILGYLALSVVNAAPISITFDENGIKPGENTTMKVVIVNTEDIDVEDVSLTVEAESTVVTIINPKRTEVTMGSKTRREFEFVVGVIDEATPGTYKLSARVTGIGTGEKTSVAYLEVKKP